MYVDPALIDAFKSRYGNKKDIMEAIDNCGIWYSLDGIRAEEEDFDRLFELCKKLDLYKSYDWIFVDEA